MGPGNTEDHQIRTAICRPQNQHRPIFPSNPLNPTMRPEPVSQSFPFLCSIDLLHAQAYLLTDQLLKVSISRSPLESPVADRHNPHDRLVYLLKKYGEAISEVTRLKAERDALEKVLKQRQMDYERSVVKHADFPSILEVQNMHRAKYMNQVRSLDTQIQKAQEEAEKMAKSIGQIIFSPPSMNSRETDNKAAVQPPQDQEASLKQLAEITDLKGKFRHIESQQSQELDKLKVEFSKRYKEFKEVRNEIKEEIRNEVKAEVEAEVRREVEELLNEMRKELRGELKEVRAMKEAKEEVKEMKEQFRTMRGELEERQMTREKSQQADLQSRFSKQEQELKKVVEQQLLEHRNNSKQQASGTQVSTLVQQESLALRSDISNLLKRVDALTGQLAQHNQESIRLRDDLAACKQQLRDQSQTVEEHAEKLSGIDLDNLDKVADMIDLTIPMLQGRVDRLPADIDNKHNSLLEQVKTLTGKVAKTVGELVQGIQSTVDAQAERIKKLESAPSTASGRPTPTGDHPTATVAELEPLKATVASIKTDCDWTRTLVDGLNEQYSSLSAQINQTKNNDPGTNKALSEELEFVRQLSLSLDTRFNNLSTRGLAEHIIGQLEQVYPNAARLGADIESLKGKVEYLETRYMSDVQEYFARNLGGGGGGGGGSGNGGAQNGGPPHKRRRTDSGQSGSAEHPVANGFGH